MKKIINLILTNTLFLIAIFSFIVLTFYFVNYINKGFNDSEENQEGLIVDCTIVNSETKKEYFSEIDISYSEFVNEKNYQMMSLMNVCQNSMLLCVEESGSIKKCSDSYIQKLNNINNGNWKES